MLQWNTFSSSTDQKVSNLQAPQRDTKSFLLYRICKAQGNVHSSKKIEFWFTKLVFQSIFYILFLKISVWQLQWILSHDVVLDRHVQIFLCLISYPGEIIKRKLVVFAFVGF